MIGLIQVSYSQGEFLLRGQSGYGGGGGFSSDREKQAFHVYAVYSYYGFLDANLTYEKANGGAVQGGVLTPRITYYFVKQEDAEDIPTLGFSVGFRHYTSKTTETMIVPDTIAVRWRSYELVTESAVNAVLLDLTAQSRTGRWKVFFFQPLLGAGFSMTNTGWEFTLRGGLSIGTRIVHGPMIILTPGVEHQSGLTLFMLTLGAVF
jgi:hypothetical protein